MEIEVVNIIFSFCAFVSFLIFHIILVRFKTSIMKSFVLSLIFGDVVLLALYFILVSEFLLEFLFNSLFYFSLAYFYFVCIGIAFSSIRVKILQDIYDNGCLSYEKILKNYNADNIINSRLERLIRSGDIIIIENKYYLQNHRILNLVRIINFFKKIFFGNTRG